MHESPCTHDASSALVLDRPSGLPTVPFVGLDRPARPYIDRIARREVSRVAMDACEQAPLLGIGLPGRPRAADAPAASASI